MDGRPDSRGSRPLKMMWWMLLCAAGPAAAAGYRFPLHAAARAPRPLLSASGDGRDGESAGLPPLNELPMGTAIDTVGDGVLDSVTVDTLGDGLSDSTTAITNMPQQSVIPRSIQEGAQRVLNSPVTEVTSLVLTLLLLASFGDGGGLLAWTNQSSELLNDLESACTVYFALEFALRWTAAGLYPRYLLTPLMVVDFVNLLPALVGANSPLPALRLLRVLRILRLRRLLGRREVDKLAKAITGDPEVRVGEVQRVGLTVALSVLSIVFITAGAAYEAEHAVNPMFASYADALYFSITTLTTVGFGDVVPITQSGRVIVALEMIAAVTLIPLEVTRLVGAFEQQGSEKVSDQTSERRDVPCPNCSIRSHEKDATFCRRCGIALPLL